MNRNRKKNSRSHLTIILSLIMVLFLIMTPMTSLGLETGTEAEVKFTGTTYDAETNASTWNYQVVSGNQPSLSHWSLAVCEEHKIMSVSDHWIETSESIDGSTGFKGLKFEKSLEANETVNVWIELEGNWETGLVDAITKSGNDFVELEVEGPTCVAAAGDTSGETGTKTGSDVDGGTTDNDANEEGAVVNETVVELDAESVITVVPEDAVLLAESDKLKVYLNAENQLLIHADAKVESEVSGKWTVDIGGQQYTVIEGKDEIIIVIDETPVGTYSVSAVFALPANDVVSESGVLNVSVPTVTGGELPTTATPYYNMLLIGAMLVLLGAFTFYRMKRYE